MRCRVIRAGAILTAAMGCVAAIGPSVTSVHAAGRPHPHVRFHPHQYQGYLTAAPASTTAPATLTVQTGRQGQISVSVTPSTRIVRRYNGASGLDELAANDVLQIRGTTTAPGAVTATWIRDISIQAAYTRLVGQVTSVTANSVSVVVQRGIRRGSPFAPGSNLTLPVGTATKVISGTTTATGSTSGITAGDRIVALGVFNRVAHNFQSTFRIRILGTGVKAHPAAYTGYLVSAPVTTTTPTTLTLQTPHNGQIAVAVTPDTKIVRRYNGASSLDELSANDVLQVHGTSTAPGTLTATRIRDVSIQAAYTRVVGQVTAVGSNSVSIVVQRDATGRAPFRAGQNLVLPVGASTQVISGTTTTTGSTAGITAGNRVVALGVFNRISNTFQSTFRIRVLK